MFEDQLTRQCHASLTHQAHVFEVALFERTKQQREGGGGATAMDQPEVEEGEEVLRCVRTPAHKTSRPDTSKSQTLCEVFPREDAQKTLKIRGIRPESNFV